MSESLFAGLCRKVGTSMQINIRREVEDIEDIVRNQLTTIGSYTAMRSGSSREGFRLEGSDFDLMFWFTFFKVLWDLEQAQNYFSNRKTLILCDCSDSLPGYTLLKLMMPPYGLEILPIWVRMNENLYISSSKYRQFLCLSLPPTFTKHGPCGGGYRGITEFDYAFCFQCDFWPPSANSWIDRCRFWPKPQIVHEIVRNGCHFVPIGHKLGNHEDHEWRISFSQAEQKLVDSMNHCQFLTYGLLKIFLKEVINKGIDDQDKLLCSYHMKTSVFWSIQHNTIPHWNSQNLSRCFWICFKLLLKWVYEGACPNFFIPKNNMFLNKIHGKAQMLLFHRLYELYERGLKCLLFSSTISPYVMKVLHNPRQFICTDEYKLISLEELEEELFVETFRYNVLQTKKLRSCIKYFETVEHLMGKSLTHYKVFYLQKNTTYFLYTAAFLFFNRWANTHPNKLMYTADKMICHMLRLAAKFGCISDMLYIAMYFYRTSRYLKALSFLQILKVKLAVGQTYLVHKSHKNHERYNHAFVKHSVCKKLRQGIYTTQNMALHKDIAYMNELLPEQSGVKNGDNVLIIPTLVMIYMLETLCSIHTDPMQSQGALHILQNLVHLEHGGAIPEGLKDISWQILGICQQITGDVHSALFSYKQSLKQIPYHGIQTVTRMRIQNIMKITPQKPLV
ncbi:uncharacterized protein LOC134233001 [Saccostrea cucullata]|uniref:uncharacterized protein LOC134233001 n=1 Tax=Saccostrea cuccullata TaxID=36930 RepID=UPI002ED5D7EE